MTTYKNTEAGSRPRLSLRPLPALLVGALLNLAASASAQEAAKQPVRAAATTAPTAPATAPATTPTSASGTAAVSATPAAPAPTSEQPVGTMQTVSVVGERPTEQIDRSVYDVREDAVTPSASAADVIANVPNVTVDQDGKVAIRGNEKTQIFVNGKRSAMFSGANGGDALNNYPADALESVEVITTPGAEFGSEGGSGPILNLITRRVRPPGGQGALTGSIGPDGRRSASLNGSYNTGRLQVEGQAGYTRALQERTGWSDTDTQVGNSTWTTLRSNASRTPSETVSLNPNVSYNIGDTDRASAALNFNRSKRTTDSTDYYQTFRGETSPYEQYRRDVDRDTRQTVYMLALGYERKFSRDEQVNFDLRSSGNLANNDSHNRNTYTVVAPTGPRAESTNGDETTSRLTEFSVDYKKKLSQQVNLKAGLKAGVNRGQSDTDYFNIDPLTGEEVIDDNRASAFKSTEKSYAVYFSSNVRLSDHWTVLPGIRYERIDRDIDYINQNNSAGDTSKKVLPSMHVQYGWGERGASLTGAYSRRIDRPKLEDIDPNLQYVDDENYKLGDPRLAPTHADKYEIKYTDSWAGVNTNLSFYRDQESPLLGRFLTPVPGSAAVISQAANFGDKTTDGVSLNVQAKPLQGLNLGATVNFRHVDQSFLATQYNDDGAAYSVESARKVVSKNLQLRAQYSGIEGHSFQFNGNYTGRALAGLFETEPFWQVQLGWTWNLAPRLILRTNIRDVFDSNVNRRSQVSDGVNSYSYSRQQGRIFAIGLTYRFGGVTGDSRLRNNGGMFRGPGMEGGPRGDGGGGFGPGGGGPGRF